MAGLASNLWGIYMIAFYRAEKRFRALGVIALSMLVFTEPLRAGDHAPAAGGSAKDAYQSLINGNERFVSGHAKHPAQDDETRKGLAGGQQPQTIILSCSDSRVAPEVIFDQGLGQVFVIRNAGHVPDSSAIASIEYAIEHLGSKLLVVMGHESCGAVKATLSTPVGKSAGSPDIDKLITAIRPNLMGLSMSAEDKTIRGPVKANVEGAARDVFKKSAIVREAVKSKGFRIVQAVYELASGKVSFNTWDMDRFDALAGSPAAAPLKKNEVRKKDAAGSATSLSAKKLVEKKDNHAQDDHAHGH